MKGEACRCGRARIPVSSAGYFATQGGVKSYICPLKAPLGSSACKVKAGLGNPAKPVGRRVTEHRPRIPRLWPRSGCNQTQPQGEVKQWVGLELKPPWGGWGQMGGGGSPGGPRASQLPAPADTASPSLPESSPISHRSS